MGISREHHVVLTSTQDRAKEIVKNLNALTWQVVTADAQSNGRGTQGRVWISPPEVNLYVTFVLPLPIDKKALLIHFPQIIAYSVLGTLKQYGLQPKLKWVNDVLLNRKKVSGVLCETETASKLQEHCFILAGIGINVNMDKRGCEDVEPPTTSLMLELGHFVDKEDLLEKLTNEVVFNVNKLTENGFSYFVDKIIENLEFLGEKITLQLDDEKRTLKEGVLKGINRDGMLLLKCGNDFEQLFSGRILL